RRAMAPPARDQPRRDPGRMGRRPVEQGAVDPNRRGSSPARIGPAISKRLAPALSSPNPPENPDDQSPLHRHRTAVTPTFLGGSCNPMSTQLSDMAFEVEAPEIDRRSF